LAGGGGLSKVCVTTPNLLDDVYYRTCCRGKVGVVSQNLPKHSLFEMVNRISFTITIHGARPNFTGAEYLDA